MAAESSSHIVGVTGASGFIAAHVIQQLLAKGYKVRGTVRSTADTAKVAHLTAMPGAADRLEFVEADITDRDSMASALKGCDYVLHVAAPFFGFRPGQDPVATFVEPNKKAVLNALEAAHAAGTVKRLVITSSMLAVFQNPAHPKDVPFNGNDFSSEEFQAKLPWGYPLSKTVGDKAALQWMDEHPDVGFKLSIVCPGFIYGPSIQSGLNDSLHNIVDWLQGKSYLPMAYPMVDVRDVAAAHIAVLEAAEPQKRYACAEAFYPVRTLVRELVKHVPEAKVADEPAGDIFAPSVDNSALTSLGVTFRPFEEAVADTVASLRAHGSWPPAATAAAAGH